jgi:hypothetical protein
LKKTDLEYILIRGLPIYYQNIEVKQPKIEDIDKIGLLTYLSMTYVFRLQKEHLQLYEEIKDKLNGKSIFESLIIQEEILTKKEDFKIIDSIIMLLIQSLSFFLDIKDFNRFEVGDDCIIIHAFKEIDGQVQKVPIFKLDNNNFDEFSELIRTITCSNILEIDKEEVNEELEHYDDEDLQRLIEEQYKIYKDDKKKEEKENEITISEIIGSICMYENSKYDFTTIINITMWQIHYYFNFLLEKENIEITKSQFTSGNFKFEKVPNLNWIKKTKVKLQNVKKIVKE